MATGWTFLTPFALSGEGAFLLLAAGLCLAALGWLLTGLNIIVTVHTRRDAGMGFFAMPLFSWGIYLTGYLLAAVGSLFSIVIVYLALSRAFAGGIFGPGSDPLLWQNYFWFVTTPAAFFALLPAVGRDQRPDRRHRPQGLHRLPPGGGRDDRPAGPELHHLGPAHAGHRPERPAERGLRRS